METTDLGIAIVERGVVQQADEVRELVELELSLVGGGCGEVVFG